MQTRDDDDDRAFFGDARDLFSWRGQIDAHDLERTAPEFLTTVMFILFFELVDHAQDGQFARTPFDGANSRGRPDIVKRVGVGQRSAVVDFTLIGVVIHYGACLGIVRGFRQLPGLSVLNVAAAARLVRTPLRTYRTPRSPKPLPTPQHPGQTSRRQ